MRQTHAIEAFDLSRLPEKEEASYTSLTLWVPTGVKEKFDKIQDKSNKRFGKYLKDVVIKNVLSVKVED